LRKTPIFFRKLPKIAENCDHNIDPRVQDLFLKSRNFTSVLITLQYVQPCLLIYATDKTNWAEKLKTLNFDNTFFLFKIMKRLLLIKLLVGHKIRNRKRPVFILGTMLWFWKFFAKNVMLSFLSKKSKICTYICRYYVTF
jgi:hypothetical protein